MLFEFEDKEWFPSMIREGMTDYLRYLLHWLDIYGPATPVLKEAINKSGAVRIVDLCSGGGGPVEAIQKNLLAANIKTQVLLTDKYPNKRSFEFLKQKMPGSIDYVAYPVNAMSVQQELKGLRTIFSGFHHFNQKEATMVLKDAVNARQGIAIFDGGDKNPFIIAAIFLHLPLFILCTPFFRPFRLSRIIFTYIIPAIPLCTVWDGIASILKLHSVASLLKFAKGADPDSLYEWSAGKKKNKFGFSIAYLLGYPKQ